MLHNQNLSSWYIVKKLSVAKKNPILIMIYEQNTQKKKKKPIFV